MNRSEISSVLGVSGIERDHLIDALKRQGVDWQAIDWRTVGEDIKDYSNKYEAIWDKLQNECGMSYPAEWRYKNYPKYKQQEYEFNAEMLKEYLKESENVSYYNQVMNALCLGTEPVPQEIDEAIGYTGRERKAFLEVLCRGYGMQYESTGWEKVDRAVDNYRRGIERFGVDSYIRCGEKEGWYAVAECLHDTKKATLSIDNMVKCYGRSA